VRTVQEAFDAVDALVLGGNNRAEEESLGSELKEFIRRQAAGLATMGAALATPSNSVDVCSGEAADIAARTASETMARCLKMLAIYGPMIAERVAVVAGVPSAAKRLSDAFKAGWVEKVGKAPNAAGRNANLYGITELGRDMFGIES
jgi:chromosome segregation and condensation protein ScpB